MAGKTSRVKSAGNFVGWVISILSGVFTLIEVVIPKGTNLNLGSDLSYLLSLLSNPYIRYGTIALFIGLLIFFVFPREEETIVKRRRSSRQRRG